jgi:hypothetical protein
MIEVLPKVIMRQVAKATVDDLVFRSEFRSRAEQATGSTLVIVGRGCDRLVLFDFRPVSPDYLLILFDFRPVLFTFRPLSTKKIKSSFADSRSTGTYPVDRLTKVKK